MPCTTVKTGPAELARMETAISRLEKMIAAGTVQLVVGASGSVAFRGWQDSDRSGVADLCAYRKLLASNSAPLRRALARAEARAGRQADARVIASGMHSHDGGRTFSKD